MKFTKLEARNAITGLFFLAGATTLLPTPAFSQAPVNAGDQALILAQSRFHPVQYRECSERVGPFSTQSTAWQRWREARSRGFAVSNGVVPCYDGGSRGYCFVAFFRC
jgi:hypothetical protein